MMDTNGDVTTTKRRDRCERKRKTTTRDNKMISKILLKTLEKLVSTFKEI